METKAIHVHDAVLDDALMIAYNLGAELSTIAILPGPFGGYSTIEVSPDTAHIIADELDGHVFEADTVGNMVPATRTTAPVRP